MGRFSQIFQEFKRRNIYKVAVAYCITGWVVVQISNIAANSFGAPEWVMKMIFTLVLLGLPVALIFAWAFEVTPEGIKRTKKVPKSESVSQQTGKKLNYWIIGLLSAAILFLLADKFWISDNNTPIPSNHTEIENASVAVLPFTDFSQNNDQDWFADGLTEELLNSLARLQGLQVAARTSSFHFKNRNIPIQQIADTLGVEHVVEGSVRRTGDEVRITAQLIRAADGFHLWSQTYDRKATDVFKVQEDISENIASALDIYLDDQKRKKMFAFGTRNVDAYEAYLKGRNIYENLHESSIDSGLFRRANPLFEKAIALDPEFAAPYYYHHDAYMHYILNYPRISYDSLSIERAYNHMMIDLDKAITHATDPGLKLIYEFEKTFLSEDWSSIPRLTQQLKESPEAQRAFIMLNGGWTRTFLAVTGHARLQYQLTTEALKHDPLHQGLKKAQIDALLNFASADRIIEAINNFPLAKKFPYEAINTQFFMHLAANKIEQADSVAQLANPQGKNIYDIILQAVEEGPEKARAEFDNLPEETYGPFKNSFNSTIVHYALGDIATANELALQRDTTALGPQELMTAMANSQIIGFDPTALPNLGLRFKEANIQTEPVKIGSITFPRIVQNEL